MRIMSLRGAASVRALLVFSIALLLGVTPALADDSVPDFGGPTEPTQSAQPAETPPIEPSTPDDVRASARDLCYFGPITLRVDPVEAARAVDTCCTGRDKLEKVLALEENPELPPFTFLISTEDDGGDDITCN